jgi:hypothetical protein
MTSSQALVILSALWLICSAAALWRYFASSLARTYWPFVGFIAVTAIPQAVILWGGTTSSKFYALAYMVLSPVIWALYIAAAWRLHSAIFSGYPGIATIGHWSLYGAVAVTVLAAAGSMQVTSNTLASKRSLLIGVGIADRCIVFCLAIFLLFLLFALSRYPIHLLQNVVVSCLVLSFLFLIEAILQLFDQVTGFHFTIPINVIAEAVTLIGYMAWTLLLNRKGETHLVQVRRKLDPGIETRLLGELDSLNEILLRAARK